MRYFVYFDRGRCDDGDHEAGLEPFDTLDEARAFEADQFRKCLGGSCSTCIVHGDEMPTFNPVDIQAALSSDVKPLFAG